ncbi:MAG TPA: phage holin family protein [Actinomycetales bacterium]|jgi:uncharacterized membrane protein YqjE
MSTAHSSTTSQSGSTGRLGARTGGSTSASVARGAAPTGGGTPERTLGQLVADASRDLSSIVKSEIALAKLELKVEAKEGAVGAAMFVVAGVLAFFAVFMLLFAIVYAMVALGLPTWASFLIVAVVLLLVAGVAALLGKKRLAKVGPPERTVRTTKETVETLKGAKPHTA